jgi:hypothetical protein
MVTVTVEHHFLSTVLSLLAFDAKSVMVSVYYGIV